MSFKKMFYWLIKIGAPLTVILLPLVAIYGTIISWAPASPILAKYESETPIMVGFSEGHQQAWIDGIVHDNSFSERQYILFPSVFAHPKIITIHQKADKTLTTSESALGFIYMVVWYIFCLGATWFLWFRKPKEDKNQSKP